MQAEIKISLKCKALLPNGTEDHLTPKRIRTLRLIASASGMTTQGLAGPFNTPGQKQAQADISALRRMGLLEVCGRQINSRAPDSLLWRVTPEGRAFLERFDSITETL